MKDPFPGATELIPYKKISKKKLKKIIKRGEVRCTCGALEKYYCELWYIHEPYCIINTKKKDVV